MLRRRALAVLAVLLASGLAWAPGVRGASFPVTQEQVVLGSTSGLAGAQTDDGVPETLLESDAAPDPVTNPSTQTLTLGSQVAGVFPADVQTSNNVPVQYREADTSISTVVTLNPGALGPCAGFTSGANGNLSDNAYAVSSTDGLVCVYTTFGFSLPGGSTVTRVELGHESHTTGNDRWTVSLSWDGGTGWCTGQSTAGLPTADPNTYTFLDFTACRAWGVSDVVNIASRFTHNAVGPADTNRLDANVARVTYTPPPAHRLDLRYDWSAVPGGLAHRLSVEGRVLGEDVQVQVLTPPATWNTPLALTSTSDQVLTYDLTASEYNGGAPAVRFVDALGTDTGQSDVWLDEVKITTTTLNYRLEVRHNITGIFGGLPAILTVKGNISPGGENFNVHAWNFTSGLWDLVLSSPFTTANAYHNASLAADAVSGGTVRVRYLDVVTPDATRHGFSLDFVKVTTPGGNVAPTLTSDGVTPTTGNISTTFLFLVRYTDPDNDAPQYVRLQLDGPTFDMVENDTGDIDYSNGKDYHYSRAMGSRGTFNYNFTTRAATWNTTVVTAATRQVQVLNRAPAITNPIASDNGRTMRGYLRDFNGSDADGDPLTWSLSTNATWLSVGAANGTVWGTTPSNPATYYVDVAVGDGFGGVGRVNYTLSIVNRLPVISNPRSSDSIHTGSTYTRDFNATDADGDTIGWFVATNATWLNLGPSNGTLWGRAPSVRSSYYVDLSAADGYGGTARLNYTLGVANNATTITNPIASDATTRSSDYRRTFTATDPDGDAITWSMVSNATFLNLGATNGTVFGRTSAVPGSFYLRVTASDPFGSGASVNYTLSVVDQGPVIINPLASEAHHPRPYVRDFNASDPEGDSLMWSLRTNATWLTIGGANGTIWGIRPPGNRSYWVDVTVTDVYGLRQSNNYTLTISNIAPVVLTSGDDSAHMGASYLRTMAASDGDGDPLLWTLATNATWLSIGAANGTIYGRAPLGSRWYYVGVTIDDGLGGRGLRNFTLTLTNANPTVLGSGDDVVPFGSFYLRTLLAADPDGDPLRWSLATNASWLAIGPTNGSLYGRAPAAGGSFFVNASVDDGLGGRGYRNFTLSLDNAAPIITSNPDGLSATRVAFRLVMAATDPEGHPITWSLASDSPALVINVATGVISTVSTPSPGTFSLRVTVTDVFGASAVRNFTVTFINQSPTISGSPPGSWADRELYSATFNASDPEGDSLGWSVASNAWWLVVVGDGRLSGIAVPGTYYVNVTATDVHGGAAHLNYTLLVPGGPAADGEDVTTSWMVLGVAGLLEALLLLSTFLRKPRGRRRRYQ